MNATGQKNIVLIGSGKVATQLGTALFNAGYRISQVYSPTKKHALSLSKRLDATAVSDPGKIDRNASIFIIAVKDDAISEVAAALGSVKGIVVHTSGSASDNLLAEVSPNHGVFYPLQSFSKTRKADFTEIPVLISASNKRTEKDLLWFARSISNHAQLITEEQRFHIHLAAVIANNFTNHLFSLSAKYLEKHDLSFDLLKPLIRETAERLREGSPARMQTGPAARGDKATIKKHLAALKDDKQLRKLYEIMSESIALQAKKK